MYMSNGYIDICIMYTNIKHPGPLLRNASGCIGLSHGYVKPTLGTTFAALWQRADWSSWGHLFLSSLFRATVFDSHFKWQLTDGLRAKLKIGPLDSSATRGLHSTAQWQQIAGFAGTHAAWRKRVFVFPSCCQNKPERSIPKRNLSEKPDSFTGRKVSEGSVFPGLFTSSNKLRVAKNRP